MYVLGIDTSHDVGGTAVDIPGGAIESLRFGREQSHLTEMDAAVGAVCESAEVGLDEIDRIALVVGPGSFTGVRIAMAWAKGIYAARPRDLVTMNGLELLALGAIGFHGRVAALIDARKDEVYAALYETASAGGDGPAVRCLIEPVAMAPTAFAEKLERTGTLFVGTGAARYRREIAAVLGFDAIYDERADDIPPVPVLTQIARRLEPLSEAEVLGLEPFYIRPSDAKLRPLKRIGP